MKYFILATWSPFPMFFYFLCSCMFPFNVIFLCIKDFLYKTFFSFFLLMNAFNHGLINPMFCQNSMTYAVYFFINSVKPIWKFKCSLSPSPQLGFGLAQYLKCDGSIVYVFIPPSSLSRLFLWLLLLLETGVRGQNILEGVILTMWSLDWSGSSATCCIPDVVVSM